MRGVAIIKDEKGLHFAHDAKKVSHRNVWKTYMYNKTTTTVSMLMAFSEYLSRCDISSNQIIKKAGMDPSVFKNPDNRITADELNRFITCARQMTNDEFLGLHLGSGFNSGGTGVVGYMMMNCATLGEAFTMYCKYQELPGDIVRIRFAKKEKYVRFHWEYNPSELLHPSTIMEMMMSAVMICSRDLCGRNLPLREAHFSYPRPKDLTEYRKFFNCDMKFDEPETALIYGREFYDTPVKSPNRELLSLMEGYAEEYLKSYRKNDTLSERVQKIIRVYHGTIPKIEMIASELGMSVRKLQLMLKEEGVSFRGLRENVQQELALEYLRGGRYSIAEISNMLGFSEPCSFTKSFKRWTGSAPGNFRNK